MNRESEETDAYGEVRALLLARKWSGKHDSAAWFADLAQAGLLAPARCASGAQWRGGLKRMLVAAEIIGGHDAPLSHVPALAGAAGLAAVDPGAAGLQSESLRALLAGALCGEGPILPALQSGETTLVMGAGGGLRARKAADGGLRLDGQRICVPGSEFAAAFIAEAASDEGVILFVVEPAAPGLSLTHSIAADGRRLGVLTFVDAPLDAGRIVARGQEAERLLDIIRFRVQLGLGGESAGLAAALLACAGGSAQNEHALAGAMMSALLARAFVFGAAGLAEPCRPGALEIIAGARAGASEAVLAAARTALAQDHGPEQAGRAERLARRALALAHIYREPAAHRRRFAQWRWSHGAGPGLFADLAAAAATFAGADRPFPLSPAVAALAALADRVRTLALASGRSDDPVFRDRFARAEIDLCGLVCADAQMRAGADIAPSFAAAACSHARRSLADCALRAGGSRAATCMENGDWAGAFVDAWRGAPAGPASDSA